MPLTDEFGDVLSANSLSSFSSNSFDSFSASDLELCVGSQKALHRIPLLSAEQLATMVINPESNNFGVIQMSAERPVLATGHVIEESCEIRRLQDWQKKELIPVGLQLLPDVVSLIDTVFE